MHKLHKFDDEYQKRYSLNLNLKFLVLWLAQACVICRRVRVIFPGIFHINVTFADIAFVPKRSAEAPHKA